MEKINSFKLWKQNPSKGEVFTPIVIINKKLDRIPEHIWTNPKSTFCDLSMGKGTYLIEVVNRLVNIYGYSEEDAKSRVFGYDIRIKYVNFLKRRGYKNVFHKDSLEENFNMKFDVVLGNPPYQKKVGDNNNEPLWDKFVKLSFEICKDDGFISLIHPSGWRVPNSRFNNVTELLKTNQLNFLSMNDFKKGSEVFGVGTNFDWYVVKKTPKNGLTEILDIDDKKSMIDINDLKIIPNGLISLFDKLTSKNEENKIEILNSESKYAHRKKNMSKNKKDDYILPCVYTITKKDGIKLWYSNEDKGHFGVPKLILSNGLGTYPILDFNGEYGLMEYSFGIVDSPQNLILIKKVIESEIFIKLMTYAKFTNDKYNRKILATFRKDFWKEFLDEDGNIIEPNFNENVESI